MYEPLQSLNGHYSIHSVNVSNPAEFGGGKTEALGVKTTADPRGTARTHWAARGKPSHPPRQKKSSDPPIRRTPDRGNSSGRRQLGGPRLYLENDR